MSKLPTLGMVTASSLVNVTRPRQQTFRSPTKMKEITANASSSFRRGSLRVAGVSALHDIVQKRRVSDTASWRSLSSFSSRRSLTSMDSSANPDGCVFTVVIESNWGSPDTVTLASVSFLNIERRQIPTLKVTSFPELPESANVSSLMNPTLVKDSVFTTRWPPEYGQSISIVFIVERSECPHYMRIFNPSGMGDACTKNVTVKYGADVVFQGEVPKSFGLDGKLAPIDITGREDSQTVLEELFPKMRKEPTYEDKYGSYPVEEVTTLNFEIVSNYSKECSENNCGLNGIELFDYEGKLVTMDDVEEIVVDSAKCLSHPSVLLREDKMTTDWEQMLFMSVNWTKPPTLKVTLKHQVKLAMIKIWNFNASKRTLDYCVRQLRVRNGSKLLWSGRLPKGKGSLSYNPYELWLTDIPQVRALIN